MNAASTTAPAQNEDMSAPGTTDDGVTSGREDFTQSQSPLLNLPGEIRNHIYTYMIQESDDVVYLYRRRQDASSPSAAPAWAELERQSLGFTQVCRLIREEFLSLYRSKTWVSLWYEDIIEYTSLVFPVRAKATGELDIRYPMDIQGRPLDIAPLVHLTLEATDLQFMFDTRCMRPEEDFHGCQDECEYLLDSFLDPHENRNGLVRAAGLFKEIIVRCDGVLKVSAQVYATYAESWMPQVHTTEWHMDPTPGVPEAIAILKSVGLRPGSADYAYKVDINAEGGEDYKTSWRRRWDALMRRGKSKG